ncbi:TNF receptor-associated factor 6 [Selaginella moellendorffii]|uniref:TNF receptor-associated factor 6 n=1 Tax=Selaginella moellendorffii TaxID=88036 RepID=UPI000D1C7E06|nr:TNF receptor-associated factor 6 [Selaginella moellendorffii]|eukprot:XP_024519116.1 TNF receptor-associated factor 6 [Selaginella moellendorffii]
MLGAMEEAPPLLLDCGYMDVRELQRIERSLQRSLAAATLERASGEIFGRRPSSLVALAAEVKKEMLDFLDQSSDSFREFAPPSAAVDDLLGEFVRSKKNLLRRMSTKIGLADQTSREGKLDEILGDLQRGGGAWDLGQCESFARSLLARVDHHRQSSHCRERVDSLEALAAHKKDCRFRPLACENDGCGEIFSAMDAASHDRECPFKVLDCEQGCGDGVARMEMERHCSTVCSMKMVSCPFSSAGCSHVLPQGALEQHHSSMQTTHLLFVLESLERHRLGSDSLVQRLSILEKSMSLTERISAADVKSLAITVKEQDAKIKKLEAELKKLGKDSTKSATDLSTKVGRIEKSLQTS